MLADWLVLMIGTGIDLASDGRGEEVDEGIEVVKFAGVVKYAEVVRNGEVIKFAEAGKLPQAMELIEAEELVGYGTLGKKKVVLMLEGELEVGQMGVRGPSIDVKEVVLEGTVCDWAVGPIVIGEVGCDNSDVEDITLPGTYRHSDAVEDIG